MSYCLKHVDDSLRLAKQSQITCYSPEDDLKYFTIPHNATILDAGCGPGIFSRYIYDNYTQRIDAFDFDPKKIEYAKLWSKDYSINYFQADITSLHEIENNKYDFVVSRYVLQHINEPIRAIHELKRVLLDGGRLIIIENSGVLFNLNSKNKFINDCLEILKNKFKVDLFAGDKIATLMESAGFKDVKEVRVPMCFSKSEMELEIDNYKSRFEIVKPLFEDIIGKYQAEKFIDSYIEELSNPLNCIEYTKVIVEGIK